MNQVNEQVEVPQSPAPSTRRRAYLQHPRVPGCDHKYDPRRQPRMRNCDGCWYAFFVHNEQLVKDTDNMFRTQGGQRIVELQGIQYLRKFLSFMAYMAEIQERVAQAAEVVEEAQ